MKKKNINTDAVGIVAIFELTARAYTPCTFFHQRLPIFGFINRHSAVLQSLAFLHFAKMWIAGRCGGMAVNVWVLAFVAVARLTTKDY